ncbi:hypothetical protein ACT29H_12295 [Thermophagus sp. OGC60D27]|uniref:hypothetical protein n=1 Tax=Thermophagus sp. OGC60D27 TaxID=3458415 RepID=UPI0040378E6C
MEFLLQMFADLLGTPSTEEVNAKAEIEKAKAVREVTVNEEEKAQETSVIFGSIQFH